MEKVTKVSISGISFTLEEEAYGLVRSYLDTLSAHYGNHANGNEIIEGIEGRIAELLIDNGGKNGTVTAAMAREVLSTIGKPEEIYEDSDDTQPASSQDKKDNVRKRLYRNPSDKKIGGVCGGLGIFFGIDPIYLRIGLLVLTLVACFTSHELWNPSWFILAYCILWICMPMALTTRQKCEMRGESLSYNEIEKEVQNRRDYEGTNKNGFHSAMSIICKLVLIFLGIVLVITGFSGIISIIAVILGLSVAGLAIPAVITNLFAAVAGVPIWVGITAKTLGIIVVFLPFVGILYCGISLLFNFKTPVWKPALIMFLVWIASALCLSVIGISTSSPFWKSDEISKKVALTEVNDTLHVKIVGYEEWENEKVFVKGDYEEYILAYLDATDKQSPRIAVYPKIELDRDNGNKTAEFSYKFFPDAGHAASINSDPIRLSSDTLFVYPVIYGRDETMKQAYLKVELKIPDNVRVIIDNPFRHEFDKEISYTNIKPFNSILSSE